MTLIKEENQIADSLINNTSNRAMVIKALTNDLKIKTLTILYNSEDSWNDYSMFASMEFIQYHCLQTVLKDHTILGFKAFYCDINADLTLTKRMETEATATQFSKTS